MEFFIAGSSAAISIYCGGKDAKAQEVGGMVKIQCAGDIGRANIPKCIRDYFSEYIQLILSKYQNG
jgi:hypothetical protein